MLSRRYKRLNLLNSGQMTDINDHCIGNRQFFRTFIES